MRTIFHNPEYQKFFEQEQYIKVQLFSEAEIEEMHSHFKKQTWPDAPFFISWMQKDFPLRLEIQQYLLDRFTPRLNEILVEYKTTMATVFLKSPSDQSKIPPHLDTSFVDERQHVGLNIWCPFSATHAANGALAVVRGSHRLPLIPRPMPAFEFSYGASECIELLERQATLIATKPGEAIIFSGNLIHYSPANCSDDIRFAASVYALPKEAEMCIFTKGADPGQYNMHPLNQQMVDDYEYFEIYKHTTQIIGTWDAPQIHDPMATLCKVLKQEPAQPARNAGTASEQKNSLFTRLGRLFGRKMTQA